MSGETASPFPGSRETPETKEKKGAYRGPYSQLANRLVPLSLCCGAYAKSHAQSKRDAVFAERRVAIERLGASVADDSSFDFRPA